MNVQSLPSMTVDAFFRWSESRAEKYELVNGVPHMLPWVKRNHNRITMNLAYELRRLLDPSRFEVATGDFAVRTGDRSIRYADIMVEASGGAGDARTSEAPILLVEILSDSTMHSDFGEKQREYLSLPTLQTYLVVAQDKRYAWCWSRDSDGGWPSDPMRISGDDAEIAIAALDVSIPLEALYRGVN